MKRILTLIAFTVISSLSVAGSPGYWRNAEAAEVKSLGNASILTVKERLISIDLGMLRSYLQQAPAESSNDRTFELTVPMPDGSAERFIVYTVPVVLPAMQAKYPALYTFAGQSLDHPSTAIRMDLTYSGFHAMTLSPNGSVFIDPYNSSTTSYYKVYYKSDARKKDQAAHCEFNPLEELNKQRQAEINQDYNRYAGTSSIAKSSGTNLRTYRAAVACTGEYSAYFGSTKPLVLSAIVTSVNRVSGVYEYEVAIRLSLIANNDTLIFLNSATDPYTNNSGSTMLGQNQTTVTSYIGMNNYDIGHVFSTGGGGIAGLGVICIASQKARGVTGSPAPVNDPFDIDYVAHEMGHQFGGNHTFNATTGSCSGNANPTTAFEPGSGSTIMAYAGICTGQDLQPHSDPYFHTGSFDEIVNFSTTSSGNNCPVNTPTLNNPPVITSIGSNHTIPISTPFVLEGVASDPDGDSITYCWEEHDYGPQGAMASPSGNATIFRSFNPTPNPMRYFPTLTKLVNNATSVGERLPTYARNLTFRLTVRDNRANGGGVTYDNTKITLAVSAAAGPFLVTAPNTAVTWVVGTQENVTWNVAGTDVTPVNAANVDIFLSTDGGYTYPITLATGVPNNGTATVTVPANVTNTARVMVKGAGNVFFDISNANFIITNQQSLNEMLSGESVNLYPNPAEDELSLSMAGNYRGEVTAMIYTVDGRLVSSLRLEKTGAGLVQPIAVDGLASGMYQLRVQTDAGAVSRKFTVK